MEMDAINTARLNINLHEQQLSLERVIAKEDEEMESLQYQEKTVMMQMNLMEMVAVMNVKSKLITLEPLNLVSLVFVRQPEEMGIGTLA